MQREFQFYLCKEKKGGRGFCIWFFAFFGLSMLGIVSTPSLLYLPLPMGKKEHTHLGLLCERSNNFPPPLERYLMRWKSRKRCCGCLLLQMYFVLPPLFSLPGPAGFSSIIQASAAIFFRPDLIKWLFAAKRNISFSPSDDLPLFY